MSTCVESGCIGRWLQAAIVVLLVGVGLAVFWPGLGGGFIFDDFANLLDNPAWKATSLHRADWQRALGAGIASDAGRPLAMLSFALNHYFTGVDPFWLKLTGVALHVFNGVLVFRLCRRLFALAKPSDSAAEAAPLGAYAAWLVALAWTIHPLQMSSALYVVQRMEVGAHTFVLLALLAYLRGRITPGGTGLRVSAGWLFVAGMLTVLGLGFKESALLVPVYALLIELVLLHFRTADGGLARRLLVVYASGIVLALALFALKVVPFALQADTYAFRDFTLGERLLTQLRVLALYLGQVVFPLPGSLVFYYDHLPVSTGLLSPPSTLRGLLVLLSLAAIAVAVRRPWPLVALGIGWFFAAHALTSNVWPLELAFEHRNYFALLGILIAAAQVMAWLTRRLHLDARRTLALLPVLLLVVLGVIHAKTWGDPGRLAMALATRNPDSARASYDLGKHLLALSDYDVDSPAFSLARREFEHASGLPRASALPDQALIIMDARTGREVPDAVWDGLREKFNRRHAGPQERNALAALAECRGRGQCTFADEQLLRTFLVALRRNQDSADLHSIYAFYAINSLHDVELAIAMGREAVRLDPGNVQYKASLAKFLAAGGSHPEELELLLAEVRAMNGNGRYDGELAEVEKLRRTLHPEQIPSNTVRQ